jgi:amino acid permease
MGYNIPALITHPCLGGRPFIATPWIGSSDSAIMTQNERNEARARVSLRREVGLAGAILLGLGSMVGTEVFVSIGIAAGVAGPSLMAATVLAAVVAAANGLSSARLAAAHAVSWGTYEYGYSWLSPAFGSLPAGCFCWRRPHRRRPQPSASEATCSTS